MRARGAAPPRGWGRGRGRGRVRVRVRVRAGRGRGRGFVACFISSPTMSTEEVVPSPVMSSCAVATRAIMLAVGFWICISYLVRGGVRVRGGVKGQAWG